MNPFLISYKSPQSGGKRCAHKNILSSAIWNVFALIFFSCWTRPILKKTTKSWLILQNILCSFLPVTCKQWLWLPGAANNQENNVWEENMLFYFGFPSICNWFCIAMVAETHIDKWGQQIDTNIKIQSRFPGAVPRLRVCDVCFFFNDAMFSNS